MTKLTETGFQFPVPGWDNPVGREGVIVRTSGLVLDPGRDGSISIAGPGVHTRNGDSIELRFTPHGKAGHLRFGFTGGMESAVLTLDLASGAAELRTSEWNRPQPVARGRAALSVGRRCTLILHKAEGAGDLVRLCDISASLNGNSLLEARDLNVLPELGVVFGAKGGRVSCHRFTHRGVASGVPEFLHVGGWQVLNQPDIDANVAAISRGIDLAAERRIRLLLTPETSLTGLFPSHAVTHDPPAVAAAERKLRRRLARTKDAPYLVVGLPVWEEGVDGHLTRLNVSRLYDPDGHVVQTCPKIHSCESDFWHGYRLHEFEVDGVPCCMHICHDGRYPETWTLPVMFGSRVILHPSNGGTVNGSIDAFEKGAGRATSTSHAFLLHINGGGGSYIAGPHKFGNVLAVSAECRRGNRSFPSVGRPVECLLDATIRVHDAFGYWPTRSFRATEAVAEAQLALYRALGGSRAPVGSAP